MRAIHEGNIGLLIGIGVTLDVWIIKVDKVNTIERLKKDIQNETTVNGLKNKIASLIDLLK